MDCPICGDRMLFCPTDGGYVCLKCQIGINEVWRCKMGDWTVKCLKCGETMSVQDILERQPCKCGNTCFEVIRTPDGKEVRDDKRSPYPDKPP